MIFWAGQDLLPNRVVKLDVTASVAGTVKYAQLNEYGIGVTTSEAVYGEQVYVTLLNDSLTFNIEYYGGAPSIIGNPLSVMSNGIVLHYSAGQAAQFTAGAVVASGQICPCVLASPRLAPLVTPYFEGQLGVPVTTNPAADLTVAGCMVYNSSLSELMFRDGSLNQVILKRLNPVIKGVEYLTGGLNVNYSNGTSGHIIFTDTLDTSATADSWTLTGSGTTKPGLGYVQIVGDTASWNTNHATIIQPYTRQSELTLYADCYLNSATGLSVIGFTADNSASHGSYTYMPHAVMFYSNGTVLVWQNGVQKTSTSYAYLASTLYRVRVCVSYTGATYAISADAGNTWTLLYDGTADGLTETELYAHFTCKTGTIQYSNISISNQVDPFAAGQATDNNVTSIRGNVRAMNGFCKDSGKKVTTAQYDKSNTTLGNITGLTVNIKNGKTYIFKATLHVTLAAASGGKYAIGGTATVSNLIAYLESVKLATSLHTLTSRLTALGGSAGEASGTTDATIQIWGSCVASADGTLTVQFALNTGTTTSSVLIGSSFIVDAVD